MNKKIYKLVEEELRENAEARNSDFVVIANVYKKLGIATSLTLSDIAILSTLEISSNKFPSFESITRARRKIQELHPELCSKEVQEARAKESEKVLNTLKEVEQDYLSHLKQNTN